MTETMFSVIMPVYNAELTVEKAVQSVLNQSFENFELIAVDDGSRDASFTVLKKLSALDARCKVISQTNGGPSRARNRALEEATGRYIVFIDADDEFEKDALESFYQAMSDCDLACGGYQKIKDHKVVDTRLFSAVYEGKGQILGAVSKMMDEEYFNQLWNKCYQRSIITEGGIKFDTSYDIGEDLLFNIEYANCATRVKCLPRSTYRYTLLSGGLTQKFRETRFETLKNISLSFSQRLKSEGLDDNQAKYFMFKSMFGCFTLLYEKSFTGNKRAYVADKLSDSYITEITSQPCFFTSRLMKWLYQLARKKRIGTILLLARLQYAKKKKG